VLFRGHAGSRAFSIPLLVFGVAYQPLCSSLAEVYIDLLGDEMKKLRFLVSLHSCDNDFQVAQAQSAESSGRKLGIDVEVVYADNDAVNQSTQLLKAIQGPKESRPDAGHASP
jgi:ABC-type sugar transport system substrate-binding protein